jgi:subtilase family serine protease
MLVANLTGAALLLLQWLSPLPGPGPQPTHLGREHAICSAPTAANASCFARVYGRSDGSVKPAAASTKIAPVGYNPAQIQSAYGAASPAAGRIAIVTAYNHPTAKSDLDTYSKTFGLPVLPTCTSAAQAGCFEKLSQRGSTVALPRNNRGWAFEASLDIEAAHAVCPSCRLSLIEADSASISALSTAVDRAVAGGAQVVSMSWGADEFATQTTYDSHFNVPGVKFVAASGDAGYGPGWPAATARVVAAGGTTLNLDSTNHRATETAWSGTGSGCSAYEAKPAWQHDTGCTRRTLTDAAAVADPATGLAVYSTYTPYGSGWFQVGGTSLSAPIIAALIAGSADRTATQATVMNHLYATTDRYDVTSGANGSCSPAYLCTATAGYDGPTGVGAPTALTAF